MSLDEKQKEHGEEYKYDYGAMMKNWRSWGSWFSWGSPVGLGIWFICVGILVLLIRLAIKY